MNISIKPDILRKHNLSVGEYLVLLMSYYDIDYQVMQNLLIDKGLAQKNLFQGFPPILSSNTKKLVAKIIVESDSRLSSCSIDDFEALAKILQEYYPDGIKAGKTYPWRDTVDEIAQKLRTLVVKFNFDFTVEEAIHATQEYVSSFNPPYTHMHTLRNFILYTKKEDGVYETESMLMTIIENNRENNKEE